MSLTWLRKKAIIDHIDSVVLPALRKYGHAENNLARVQFDHKFVQKIEVDASAVEIARKESMLKAVQATNELYHLADFVRKEKLPNLLFGEIKDVSGAIEVKCDLANDINLLRDIAEAFKRHRPDEPSATAPVEIGETPISIGFSRMHLKDIARPILGHFDQVAITNTKGETRPLLSVLQNVLDAWMRLLDQPRLLISD